MIICYLAGPIDYERDKGSSWKNELLGLCEGNKDIGFFDPFAPFKFGKVDQEMATYIHDVNMLALRRADVLVGRLMRGQTAVGTPIELYDVRDRKPMIIWTDMAESVYMQYIGVKAHLVRDINELYGTLIRLAGQMEEDKAKYRAQSAELGALRAELTKFQAEEAKPSRLVGVGG